jgi:hypothetical protein
MKRERFTTEEAKDLRMWKGNGETRTGGLAQSCRDDRLVKELYTNAIMKIPIKEI